MFYINLKSILFECFSLISTPRIWPLNVFDVLLLFYFYYSFLKEKGFKRKKRFVFNICNWERVYSNVMTV